ncbi:MAG TPA: hypothetical protein VKU00_00170 [Chthonomonadaceae bacterium]|nr:hypothetical protein [Chthonomonadaceae bacterium]
MNKNILKIMDTIAQQEAQFQNSRFLAPCVQGGQVRARIAGLVKTFRPRPADFAGWGLFQPREGGVAEMVEEAGLPLVMEYLNPLPALRLRLAYALQDLTWLAYPINESDARQRLGSAKPLVVHLVTEGAPFEPIVARGGGGAWWFEMCDRRADPIQTEKLQEALRRLVLPEEVQFPGLTPEMRAVYGLVASAEDGFETLRLRREAERAERERRQAAERLHQQRQQDATRLRKALQVGGGNLAEFRDRGEYWLVDWSTRNGQRHTSAICKRDLTVISSGICLSDQDRDFDLQSLVGVIEKRDRY